MQRLRPVYYAVRSIDQPGILFVLSELGKSDPRLVLLPTSRGAFERPTHGIASRNVKFKGIPSSSIGSGSWRKGPGQSNPSIKVRQAGLCAMKHFGGEYVRPGDM